MTMSLNSGLFLLLPTDSAYPTGTPTPVDQGGLSIVAFDKLQGSARSAVEPCVGRFGAGRNVRTIFQPIAAKVGGGAIAGGETAKYHLWRETPVILPGGGNSNPTPTYDRQLFAIVTATFDLSRPLPSVFGRSYTYYAAKSIAVVLADLSTSPAGVGDTMNTGLLGTLASPTAFSPATFGLTNLRGAALLPDMGYPGSVVVECLQISAGIQLNALVEQIGLS